MSNLTPDQVAQITAAVEAIHAEQVEFLQEIVQIPSITGNEGAVQERIAARLRGAGLEVDVWEPTAEELAPHAVHVGQFETLAGRPNVVGTLAGSGDGRTLILNAHIDTVETGDESRWTYPPFGGVIADGRLYGRGSVDMKAGWCTNFFALEALRTAGLALKGNVLVEAVISEEDGGAGAIATLLRGHTADAAVITEPTRLRIVPAQGGSLVFRIHFEGRSAHACVRDEGVSAIELFSYMHRALLDYEAARNAAIDHPLYANIANKIPINIGVIHGGSWPSSAPEWCFAEGRAGLVPGETMEQFTVEFLAEIDRAAEAHPWLREHKPRVEFFSGQFAPSEIPADAPIVQALASAHQANTGESAVVEGVTYGADMRHFLNFGNIPCVMYGAGDVRVAHWTDEYVVLDELLTATKTIALLVAEWCGIEG